MARSAGHDCFPTFVTNFNRKVKTQSVVHTQIKAGLLALLLGVSWSLRMGHALLMHHTHRDLPVCEAAQQGNATHLHDERYHPDDCSVCAFLFAIPDLVGVSFLLERPERIARRSLPVFIPPCLTARTNSVQLRGPPVL